MLITMVINGRSMSVFLAVGGISSVHWGCETIMTWDSLPPLESCVTASSLGTWLWSGVVLLVAVVLRFAPWSRFIGHRLPVRPFFPARYKRRLGRIGGWSLMALGMGV
jgi:hypothetical protein